MRSLQLKLAVILVGSIVAVMLIATAATTLMTIGGDASRMIGTMAEHITLSADLIGDGGTLPDTAHRREALALGPADGVRDEELSTKLAQSLHNLGKSGEVIVTLDPFRGQPVASYQLADGRWAIFAFPRPISMSPEFWGGLTAWLVLVLVGVIAVALATARRAVQPFAILEHAIASIGPDGCLPHVPESGSGTARQTAMALNLLSERLRAAMDSRMRLVAAAGHDLRTPMTRMRLRAEFLPEDERASWVADIDELEQIADSAINLVREETENEDQSIVALDAVVTETVSDLSASRLSVHLVSAEPARVKVGPLSLRRALRNLITNAATHGGGAQVLLRTEGSAAQVVIEDDGPGIPKDLLPKVFEPFFRVDSGRRKAIKGAGLGLAIAREIIERAGGSIEIENRPSGGLRQIVTLNQVMS